MSNTQKQIEMNLKDYVSDFKQEELDATKKYMFRKCVKLPKSGSRNWRKITFSEHSQLKRQYNFTIPLFTHLQFQISGFFADF